MVRKAEVQMRTVAVKPITTRETETEEGGEATKEGVEKETIITITILKIKMAKNMR